MANKTQERLGFVKGQYGENWRKLRESTNYTVREFEKIITMSYSSISKIENELAFPTIEQINLYQEYFKVSLDYLVGLTENTSVELNKITHYTGLSQSAIERLHHYLEQANSSISSSEKDNMILCDNASALKIHWITELYNDLICDEAFAELLKELYDLKRTTKLLTDTLGIIDDFSSIVEGSLRGLIIKSQIIDVDLTSKINELKEKYDIRKSELYRQRLESIINSLESKTGIAEDLTDDEIDVAICHINGKSPRHEINQNAKENTMDMLTLIDASENKELY